MPELAPEIWAFAFAVSIFAGFVKGLVGFAAPMIMISGFAMVMPPEQALAFLILSALVLNVWQAVRTGLGSAWVTARKYWRFILVLWLMMVVSAQLFLILPDAALFLCIGTPIVALALVQLIGWTPRISPNARTPFEIIAALAAGFLGGISGIWGPATTLYLTALDTEKTEQIRVQGVIYGTGAVVLLIAHIRSGVFNSETAPASALMLVPALLGMGAGFWLQDRIDQVLFRRLTLVVLVVAGLNLVRRGLMGV